MIRYYLNQNVFDAALDRIRYLFDEFHDVIVSFSGGKDSTVVLNLALQVAKEKNRLPVKVLFIDQEAEWATVISYVKTVMYDSRVDPYWFQIPLRLFNSTSTTQPWLFCWDKRKEALWVHEKDLISKKDNIYGTDRFKELFSAIHRVEFPPQTCMIGGVRCEESPVRTLGLTSSATYKDITWGKIQNKALHQFTFYPIYDWGFRDVWHAIEANHWPYCRIYDYMYQYGYSIHQMRVSNVHHETAVQHLFFLQEIEPNTWDRLTKRIRGINTAGKLNKDDFFAKQMSLPFMFADWKEYRDYLLSHLIQDIKIQEKFRHKFEALDCKFEGMRDMTILYKAQINTILTNDYYFTKLENFCRTPRSRVFLKWKKTGKYISRGNPDHEQYLPDDYRVCRKPGNRTRRH